LAASFDDVKPPLALAFAKRLPPPSRAVTIARGDRYSGARRLLEVIAPDLTKSQGHGAFVANAHDAYSHEGAGLCENLRC
jgi:hypothetical protein